MKKEDIIILLIRMFICLFIFLPIIIFLYDHPNGGIGMYPEVLDFTLNKINIYPNGDSYWDEKPRTFAAHPEYKK